MDNTPNATEASQDVTHSEAVLPVLNETASSTDNLTTEESSTETILNEPVPVPDNVAQTSEIPDNTVENNDNSSPLIEDTTPAAPLPVEDTKSNNAAYDIEFEELEQMEKQFQTVELLVGPISEDPPILAVVNSIEPESSTEVNEVQE